MGALLLNHNIDQDSAGMTVIRATCSQGLLMVGQSREVGIVLRPCDTLTVIFQSDAWQGPN